MARPPFARPVAQAVEFHGMLTSAPSMLALFELIRRVARADSPVLVRGETGTGKELCARALHALGPRSKGPFRAVNCATLTPELLASELFGHVRGSFTGAIRDRLGLFSQANGGTLFLDEIAELPIELQARLLRVLQDHTFVPLGGVEPLEVDVRLLSATHKSLRDLVRTGGFREDLMYRVRVVTLHLPPLAEREGDVMLLTWRFIDEFNARGLRRIDAIAADAADALLAYGWPGNVRELRNNVEQAFALGEGPILEVEELAPEVRGLPPDGRRTGTTGDVGDPGGQGEASVLRRALVEAGGRKAVAAQRLGMSRSTLWRKLRELELVGRRGR